MPILSRKILQKQLKGLGQMAEVVAIERNDLLPGAPDPSPAQIGHSREGGDQLGEENNNALRHSPSAPINNATTFNWLRR
jgi:hypothetical protein